MSSSTVVAHLDFPYSLRRAKLTSLRIRQYSSLHERLESHMSAIEATALGKRHTSAAQLSPKASNVYDALVNSVDRELRELCMLFGLDEIEADTSSSKGEVINIMLQSLKLAVTASLQKQNDISHSSTYSEGLRAFLLDIDDAKDRVVDMSDKLQSETSTREELERRCNIGALDLAKAHERLAISDALVEVLNAAVVDLEQNLVETTGRLKNEARLREETERKCNSGTVCLARATDRVTSLEATVKELKETLESKSKTVNELELNIEDLSSQLKNEVGCREELDQQCISSATGLANANEKVSTLETEVKNMTATVEMKSKVAKNLQLDLIQLRGQHRKLEVKHENATSEIASCQKLVNELKKIVIEKNKEISSKEGVIMELQFKIDDLSSRADEGENTLAEYESTINNLTARTEEHDRLASEVAKLEEKVLQMIQDETQQSSMHQSIVEGLEAKCQILSEENDEAREYICSLEDMQDYHEANIGVLKKDCEEKARQLKDMESACTILRQQKATAERLSNEMESGISTLTDTVLSHSDALEGFSAQIKSPATWSLNLECIDQFIQYSAKMSNQYLGDIDKMKENIARLQSLECSVAADAVTPKARGRGEKSFDSVDLKQSDLLNDLMSMKDAIKNVMESPQLTPMKKSLNDSASYTEGYNDDLYSDLVRAVDQLERLSEKIEVLQHEQTQWKGRECQFILRIEELEEEVKAQVTALEAEQARKERMSANAIKNFRQRRHEAVLRRAFHTWSSQAKLKKHLNIVREMAKELIETRKKVLLLKSHFDS